MYFAMFISATRARSLIQSGCTAYLASVDLVSRPTLSLEDIPVVREFRNVFPDELPGMPPEREIEFTINLVPDTLPISKAPYPTAFVELKELKVQLEDLLA